MRTYDGREKMKYLWLLCTLCLCLLLLCACAPRQALPLWTGPEVSAQFSARVRPQAENLPLQGGLRMNAQGGRMGLITQHGRTVGHCAFTPGADGMVWQCEAAPGMRALQGLLPRVAEAAYSLLLEQDRTQKAHNNTLQAQRYNDTLGEVDVLFTEIRRP